MARWISLLFILLLSKTAFGEESCGLRADLFALKLLAPITQKTCEEIRETKECKDLYAEMGKDGEDTTKQLQCKNQTFILQKLENDFDMTMGCAMGGANFVIDTFKSVGTAIGEGFAKIAVDAENQEAQDSICDKDPAKKKALYTDYNASVPKMLGVELPPEEVFGRVDCARLRAGLHMARVRQSFFAMDKVRSRIGDPNAKYNADEKEYVDWINKMRNQGGEGPHIIALAKQKLNEMGIKIQCYNQFVAAAIICEAAADIATLVAGPAAAALKAARTAKIMRLAGVAEKTTATTRTAKAAVDLGRAGKLTDMERLEEASKVIKRKLTSDQGEAILDAHKVGKAEGRSFRVNGGVEGEYSFGDLKNKAKSLKKANFIKTERRDLIENGIVGQSPATRVGRADQTFMPTMEKAMISGNKTTLETASSEGAKYFKAKARAPIAEFKQSFPENGGVADIIQANYFGLGTEDTAQLVNRYVEVHNFNPEQGKLAIISRLKRENKFFRTPNPKIDQAVADYRIYRNKELEYKLTQEYYEARYPNKYNELDFDKLSPGQQKNLEKLSTEVKRLRDEAQRKKWPTANEYQSSP
jgi:hypothetical protein